MGHLSFAVFLVCFIFILVGSIYFHYISAVRKRKDNKVEISDEINKQGVRFETKKKIKAAGCILIPIVLVSMFFLFKELKEELKKSEELWILIDMLILCLMVFFLLFLTGLRSYVYIHEDGFEYRRVYGIKSYCKDEIEFVCRTTEFIFIKIRDSRIPVIIEPIYGNNDELFRMLCSLKS